MEGTPLKTDEQILILNCGSSSIKVSLFATQECLLDLLLSGINSQKPLLEVQTSVGKQKSEQAEFDSIELALEFIFQHLQQEYHFQFQSLSGIGHRFVHGGNKYKDSTVLTPTVITNLENLVHMAPLHNRACLAGIKTCARLAPAIPQVAVFDTSFFQSIPEVASTYAIPKQLGDRYQIKRYGFHGISHHYLWNTLKRKTVNPSSKVISLHLGNGCSAAAISNGVCVDTSMGFSPSEGLIMATRAGDLDVSIMEYLCQQEGKTAAQVLELLNNQSGLLGISELSSNMEQLIKEYEHNAHAKLAVDMFCYRVVKYLGAYMAILKGLDAVIFSGGIGENAPFIREKVVQAMEWCGLQLNEKANEMAVGLKTDEIMSISQFYSRASIFVIPTDENALIRDETAQKIF